MPRRCAFLRSAAPLSASSDVLATAECPLPHHSKLRLAGRARLEGRIEQDRVLGQGRGRCHVQVCARSLRSDRASRKIRSHDRTRPLVADAFASQETKKSITERSVRLILRKEKLDAEYWPRLTEQKGKNSRISTDFSLYVDEDEQEGAAGVDESEFGGMGGGMPGKPRTLAREARALC